MIKLRAKKQFLLRYIPVAAVNYDARGSTIHTILFDE